MKAEEFDHGMTRNNTERKEEMIEEAKVWPVDFEQVGPGSYFSPEQVGEIFGTTPGDDRHRLACLGLKGTIETKLASRKVYVTCVVQGDGVRVLSHWEATNYTAHQFAKRYRGMASDVRRIVRIDTSEFSTDQLKMHERHVHTCATTYLAAKKGKREALLSLKAPATPKALPE